MDFEKKVVVDAPIARVWELLLDPTVMAACVPGTESVEVISDVEYLANLKVKISFISARFKVRTKILETREPHYLKSEGTGEDAAVGSSLKQSSELTLKELSEDKTELTMKISVEVFGRLGSFGLSIMKTKADRMWEEFGENFNARATAGTSLELDVVSQERTIKASDEAGNSTPADTGAAEAASRRQPMETVANGHRVTNGQAQTHSPRHNSWWKRLFSDESTNGDAAVSVRRLPTDIYAEIERDGTVVRLIWPAENSYECGKWISDYLK